MAKVKNVAQGEYVTVIAPKDITPTRLRVAAYVRVSSDSTDQINSYIAQVDYYTRFISQRDGWELVDVYADEGLTGMETSHREAFNRMIADCRNGKIDRILVKSISRFSRNQEDYIRYMRELLRLGVTIHFEKENIDTGKMSSEQAADIYGAFAQMETTAHSRNMRVSNRMRMERGIFIPPAAPYGYRLVNKELEIVPEEAEIVRHIYRAFLSGRGKKDIAKELTDLGIKRSSASDKWYAGTVDYILTNVTYMGDQIWQKSYATDVLPFRQVRNHGQRPKYYVEDCCPAIISKKDFRLVQALIQTRNKAQGAVEGAVSALRRHVYCAECGCLCRGKWINGQRYWLCQQRDMGKIFCPVPQVAEVIISEALCRFYLKMQYGGKWILHPILTHFLEIRDREMQADQRIGNIDAEIAKISEQNLVLTRLKSKGYMDSALYVSELDGINARAKELRKLRRGILESTREDQQIRQTEEMIEYLENAPDWLDAVDEELFTRLVDRLYLTADSGIVICLRNGLEVTEGLNRAVK